MKFRVETRNQMRYISNMENGVLLSTEDVADLLNLYDNRQYHLVQRNKQLIDEGSNYVMLIRSEKHRADKLEVENEQLKEENNYLKRILKTIVPEIESEYGAV